MIKIPESSSLELMRLQLSTACSGCQFLVGDKHSLLSQPATLITPVLTPMYNQQSIQYPWWLSRGTIVLATLLSYSGLKFDVGVPIDIKSLFLESLYSKMSVTHQLPIQIFMLWCTFGCNSFLLSNAAVAKYIPSLLLKCSPHSFYWLPLQWV